MDEPEPEYIYLRSLKSVVICRNYPESGDSSLTLTLHGINNVKDSNETIRVVFSGVRQLEIGDAGRALFMKIRVQNIRSWGLEGTKFKVSEVEDNFFDFVCADLRIEVDPQIGTEFVK